MAFENDPEGYRIAQSYAGSDFAKPKIVQHDLMREYWKLDQTLESFRDHMAALLQSVPQEYRATAKVQLYDQGYDSGTIFHIFYEGPENSETVADRVRRCEEYVAERRPQKRGRLFYTVLISE